MTTAAQVRYALAWLERRGTKRNREGMARYAITAPKVFGVSMATMQALARELGRDHALAEALWQTGWYEARMLTAFVDEPERVTAAQMDRWARDFDNWAICDTLCFKLFDRTPHAWRKIHQWSTRREEFVKRAAFALLASVALHDKQAPDEPFLESLALIERAAEDERNFVKKGVSWALRAVGRRNQALNTAAIETARRLAGSAAPAPRWVGKDALRELSGIVVQRQLERRSRQAPGTAASRVGAPGSALPAAKPGRVRSLPSASRRH
jgi:3-methyladenine DNA glycosylase AlkD